jgi:hypothetical protein
MNQNSDKGRFFRSEDIEKTNGKAEIPSQNPKKQAKAKIISIRKSSIDKGLA